MSTLCHLQGLRRRPWVFTAEGGAREAVLWLVFSGGTGCWAGTAVAVRHAGGTQGRGCGPSRSQGHPCPSLPQEAGAGGQGTPPKDSRGPSTPHSAAVLRSACCHQGGCTHTCTHTHAHAVTHTLARSVHLSEGKNRVGSSLTSTRHQLDPTALQLKLRIAAFTVEVTLQLSSQCHRLTSPAARAQCRLPGGPEGGWQWGLRLPSALPSPSLARERTLSPCGLPRPIRAVETLPSTLGRSPVTCWGRSHNQSVGRGRRTKCTNQDEAQGPDLCLQPASAPGPQPSVQPQAVPAAWFWTSHHQKAAAGRGSGRPGPGRTAGLL